ncbi:MAG TPA: thioredoxin [Burkholderiales bacterium]|nr:thioredoxin [Burkholderiales bacterium]
MTTVSLTQDNFDQTVDENPMLIVDFWAPWCGPCRSFAPTFEHASDKHPDVVFGKVNTEEHPELAGAFGIRSIPTLMILREKVILYSEAGALPQAQLHALIEQAKALDMERVRRELAEQEAQEAKGTDAGA